MSLVNSIGNYEIKREVGRGGMGVVYEGYDKRLDRIVAIKVVDVPALDPNMSHEQVDELIQRFKLEAKAIAKLTHPNIVNVYDYGEENDRHYMVMEFLQGRSFQQLISASAPLNTELVLKSMVQACDALDFAHQNGIIHRDIKPGNIILLDNGVTKIMDFGIARLEASQSGLTKAGMILGSLLYISPEQLISAQKVDRRADIYSLGVSMYEMLTGKLPYGGTNIGEIVMQIMQAEPLLPSQLNSNLPPELDAIIFKAMAKEANKRFERAKDMGDALNTLWMQTTVGNTMMNQKKQTAPLPPLEPTTSAKTGTGGKSFMQTFSTETANFTMVEGVDDTSLFSVVNRVMQSWHVENLGNKPLLEILYKEEGRTWGLLVNNNVILLVYRGLILGAIAQKPEAIGHAAYEILGAANKFELKAYLPPTHAESWMILLAAMIGANKMTDRKPACSSSDCNSIAELLKKDGFTGYLKIISGKSTAYNVFLDGETVFTVTVPSQGGTESGLLDIEIYRPRINLIGPSLRRALVDSSLEIISKSHSRSSLKQFASQKPKDITAVALEEAIRNTDLAVLVPSDVSYPVGEKIIKYSEIIKELPSYRIMNWLLSDLLYNVSRSPQYKSLKTVFNFIWNIKSINFLQSIKLEDSELKFDLVSRDINEKILFVGKYSNNKATVEEVKKFIQDVIKLKKGMPHKDNIVASAIINPNGFPIEVMQYFEANTGKPFPMGLFDFANAQRGFVKMGLMKGFYLYLIHDLDSNFKIVEPANLVTTA